MPNDQQNEIACAIRDLAFALRDHTSEQKMEFNWRVTHHDFATKHDIHKLEETILMKISQVAAVVAEIKKNNREAFAELGTRIADLNQQIADLIAGASDPDVTDEQFLADLNDAKTDAQALANIVPGTPSGGGTSDGSSNPVA